MENGPSMHCSRSRLPPKLFFFYSWYRIWVFFLAYSTIISRCVRLRLTPKAGCFVDSHPSQGSASVFQITMHKNLNAYHRINGVTNHASIHVTPNREISYVSSRAERVDVLPFECTARLSSRPESRPFPLTSRAR